MNINNKVVVTGGTGRFAKSLKKKKSKYNFIYPSKQSLNILKLNSIKKYLKKTKPKYVLHLAGLSRPMIEHYKNINKSISLNIIGTANLVNVCSDLKIRLIYLSTSYVYQGKQGNYKEDDPVLPWNNYAWSKLGGECAVQMYKNSLILRVCMTEKPFVHKKAFANVKLNFIFHEDLVNILIKVLNLKGIINIGGPAKTVFNFAKKYNPNVKKIYNRIDKTNSFPPKPFMNLSKLKRILK
ncbi:sugar nucleotide-binding protein [Pelagibacteraceae bacterium]|nr:sugar nucleotide-binding protein [Pelagibacteraceae bacterium]